MGRYGAWRTALLTGMIVVLTTLGLPRVTAAQRPGQVPRIAFLGINFPPSTSAPSPFRDEFRQGLRERGWVEGHTIAIEWRWAEGSFDRFASLVAEVIRLPVEVIVVPTATTAAIAKRATTTIPIVVIAGGALLETGLIASLARPGGNITGIHGRAWELASKQLELLKQAVPSVTQVAVLGGLNWSRFPPELNAELMEPARSLGMELHFFNIHEPSAFDSAFAAMTTAHVQALLVLGDPFFAPYLHRIADFAAQQQLPSICLGRSYAEAGCLMSYGFSLRGQGQLIAVYVDKILRGAKPADLPVEQLTQFEFVINLKTAQTLGLTIPPTLLFQANEVIR